MFWLVLLYMLNGQPQLETKPYRDLKVCVTEGAKRANAILAAGGEPLFGRCVETK